MLTAKQEMMMFCLQQAKELMSVHPNLDSRAAYQIAEMDARTWLLEDTRIFLDSLCRCNTLMPPNVTGVMGLGEEIAPDLDESEYPDYVADDDEV